MDLSVGTASVEQSFSTKVATIKIANLSTYLLMYQTFNENSTKKTSIN